MIEKKVNLISIENVFSSYSVLLIKLEKQIIDNGIVIFNEFHRMSLYPNVQIDEQIKNTNLILNDLGYPNISLTDESKIKSMANLFWTPEVISNFNSITLI